MKDRIANLKRLKEESFDLLIIGGGATGSGVSLDAAGRGITTALIEKGDFACGTSSKSTKLIHGGVRYLREALRRGNISQLSLVREGLKERHILLKIAPHLVRILPIVIPVNSWGSAAYYLFGMKIYEWLSGKFRIGKSVFLSAQEVKEAFPCFNLKDLKGGIQFLDCQFDDARMNLSLVLTARDEGAVILNYVEAIGIEHKKGKISSVQVIDRLTGEVFFISAKVVINAAGPLSDHVRVLDNREAEANLVGSLGTHVVLDGRLTPGKIGLLIPKTSDGRVLFLLPWQGSCLVGTTDVPCNLAAEPIPSEAEIYYLITHLECELGIKVKKEELKSCWAGVRPLISSKAKETASLSRGFRIIREKSGLYSIIGGKWTSYRRMAETLLDQICKREKMAEDSSCKTNQIPLVGADGFSPKLALSLIKEHGLEPDVAEHLSNSYGKKAEDVVNIAKNMHLGLERIAERYPYIMGEILYAVRCEMACTVQDILLRRTRLGTLDLRAALNALPKIARAMQQELDWDTGTLKDQMDRARIELNSPISSTTQAVKWSD